MKLQQSLLKRDAGRGGLGRMVKINLSDFYVFSELAPTHGNDPVHFSDVHELSGDE
jgi:hypothetical protein